MVRVFRDTTELVRSVGRVRLTVGFNSLHMKTANMETQFLGLSVASPDPTYKLMAAFHADSHPNKVSLITGAYRDEEGRPWVLPSVRQVGDLLGIEHVH